MKKFFQSLVCILLLALTSSVSFSQVKKQTERYPDDPAAREEYDFTRLRDPKTNEITPFIAQKEFEFASKLPKRNPFRVQSSAAVSDWEPAGPANQSGRIQAVGIDILNEKNMLAGAASGGVWRSIDGGASWVKVTLPNDEQSISAIVQDTRKGKESTWYYSTGELLSTTGRRETSNIRTHSWGNGIYKSTDNGTSWNPLPSTVTTSTHTVLINFTGIWNLALDQNKTLQDIIYAACYGGIMRSSDGGATWTNVLGGDSAKCFNSEIVMGSGGTLYAAIGSAYDGTATPHQGVWRSSDGIHWINISDSSLPKLIRRSRLALSQSDDNIFYLFTEAPDDWTAADQIFNTQHTLLRYSYLSGDGTGAGGKWQSRIIPSDYGSLGGYGLVLAVHPDDPNTVFVGGTNLYYSANGFGDSSGFIHIGGYPYDLKAGSLHPDMHTVRFSNQNHSKLYVGNDGGVGVVDDFHLGDGKWANLDNGLSTAQVYHSSLDHGTTGDNFIVSGLQDNSSYATLSADPNTPWDVVSGGDGMTTGVCNGGNVFCASWQGANINISTKNGDTSITYHGHLPGPPSSAAANFFTNFLLEPNETDQLFLAVGNEVWRYNNLLSLVTKFDPIPSYWDPIAGIADALAPFQGFVTAFGFAKDFGDRLFIGSNVGKVFEIYNARSQATALIEISGDGFPQNGFVAGIEVDPSNGKEIIVVFSNYNVQSLFRTTDGGSTWNPIGGNLEELPDGAGSGPSVRCAKILHTPGGIIYYVGTSVGLYSTTKIDGMQTVWTQEAPTTIGNLIVESLDARQSDGRVIVSTQGGGVFRNVIVNSVGGRSASAEQFLQLEQNYPNPFSNNSNIRFSISKSSNGIVELYNALGEKIGFVANGFFDSGSHIIALSGKELPAGNYFIRVIAGNAVATKMITIVK